jgi:hypothetical protein
VPFFFDTDWGYHHHPVMVVKGRCSRINKCRQRVVSISYRYRSLLLFLFLSLLGHCYRLLLVTHTLSETLLHHDYIQSTRSSNIRLARQPYG